MALRSMLGRARHRKRIAEQIAGLVIAPLGALIVRTALPTVEQRRKRVGPRTWTLF